MRREKEHWRRGERSKGRQGGERKRGGRGAEKRGEVK